MKLPDAHSALRRRLDEKAVVGWSSLWAAFVALIQEPLDEAGINDDAAVLEVMPAHPPYSLLLQVHLTRRVGLPARRWNTNIDEARLTLIGSWQPDAGTSVDADIIEGRAASAPQLDAVLTTEQFIAAVESSPSSEALSRIDDSLVEWEVRYSPPDERD